MSLTVTTLIAHLLRLCTRQRAASATEDEGAGAADPELADDDALPRGCGWVVSSLELRSGLAVIEHDMRDLAQLPGSWLGVALQESLQGGTELELVAC